MDHAAVWRHPVDAPSGRAGGVAKALIWRIRSGGTAPWRWAALAYAVGNQTEAAYARSDLFERRRRLMDEWADYLRRQCG